MKKLGTMVLGTLLALTVATAAQAEMATFKLDPDHTTVGFKIRHMFSNVQGNFAKFDGAFQLDPKTGMVGGINGAVETASVNTQHVKRDGHLRNPDFFDVEKHPTMSFKSKDVKKVGDHMEVSGDLTLKGITKPVVFKVEFLGVGSDPWGRVSAGLTATTRIDRKDFGMDFNKVLDTGGLLLGDKVDIILEIEAHQK